ncbi:MAG: hypothetical protein LBH80_01280 [Prevotellaceae bacterium]|jgi:hypothetical protein|nr:hypothetical protein [Prevotellaceae bacterium]
MTNKELIEKYERGVYIDYELTEEELRRLYFESKEDFEKNVTARDLCSLYTYRHNDELGLYFVSKAEWYNPFPVNGEDFLAIETGE